jgi:hypothetical protein
VLIAILAIPYRAVGAKQQRIAANKTQYRLAEDEGPPPDGVGLHRNGDGETFLRAPARDGENPGGRPTGGGFDAPG